mmetsp:Transcript_47905/g.133471  ORF Transcript_47905/g.133471 Transcript_47905/m.133471 type:complete len:171 (-) Transcript_47905:75-587(-)
MGDTAFILNAITETIGYYIWYLPKISFITDAFPLLGPATAVLSTDDEPSWSGGRGGAPDGISASDSWMDGWTIFYWGWWISWGPFVGTFMAKISRGRTLGQFITCSLIVPSLYSFFFMGVWGAEGIRLQNMAEVRVRVSYFVVGCVVCRRGHAWSVAILGISGRSLSSPR